MLPIAPSTETRPCLETVCKNDAPRMIHLDATGGEAAEILYSVFPGMELIYRDIHARSCREARGGSGERLEIHHCLEGRVEYRQNGRYFYLAPGDLVVARASSLPQGSRFPTGHYHGIAVVIDPADAPECLSCILSDVEVRPAALMEKLCPGGAVFAARSSRRVKHVFSELYAVPGGYPQGIPESKAVGAAAVSQHAGASLTAGSWLHRFAGDTGGAGARLPAGGTGSDCDPAGIVPPVRCFRSAGEGQLCRSLWDVPGGLCPFPADVGSGGAAAGYGSDSAGYCRPVRL